MKKLLSGLCAVAFAATGASAFAESTWPDKPIRAVVPFAAGAATDVAARAVLSQLSDQIGQPIIVENRPGAGGTIGASAVANAEPDGYTILVHSNSHTVSPSTYSNLNYDPKKDLIGITPLVSVPMVMVTSTEKGYKTLQDLVDAAKADPDKMNYVSAGTGGATHLGAERVRMSADYQAVHIPTKSSSEALTEVISGRADYYLSPVGMAVPQAESGRLVPLAVTSTQRSSAMPDVPTTEEAGFPNSTYDVWIAMFTPAGTPDAIIERLNTETLKALESPGVQERFTTLMMDAMPMSTQEFGEFLEKEFDMNAELVQAAGVESN